MTDAALTDDELVQVAERYLENSDIPPDPQLREALRTQVETWEARLGEVDQDDPLYDALESQVRDKRERYQSLSDDDPADKRKILRAAADRFVPEGAWLADPVLEALNRILFGKVGETLVVEQQIVERGVDLTEEATYEVSMAVREHAEAELERMA